MPPKRKRRCNDKEKCENPFCLLIDLPCELFERIAREYLNAAVILILARTCKTLYARLPWKELFARDFPLVEERSNFRTLYCNYLAKWRIVDLDLDFFKPNDCCVGVSSNGLSIAVASSYGAFLDRTWLYLYRWKDGQFKKISSRSFYGKVKSALFSPSGLLFAMIQLRNSNYYLVLLDLDIEEPLSFNVGIRQYDLCSISDVKKCALTISYVSIDQTWQPLLSEIDLTNGVVRPVITKDGTQIFGFDAVYFGREDSLIRMTDRLGGSPVEEIRFFSLEQREFVDGCCRRASYAFDFQPNLVGDERIKFGLSIRECAVFGGNFNSRTLYKALFGSGFANAGALLSNDGRRVLLKTDYGFRMLDNGKQIFSVSGKGLVQAAALNGRILVKVTIESKKGHCYFCLLPAVV